MNLPSDAEISAWLVSGKLEEIIIALMPLATKIGRNNEEYIGCALLGLVESVNRLASCPHTNYVKYIATCIKGKVRHYKCRQSVVPYPEDMWIEYAKKGRLDDLKHQYIDMDVEHDDLMYNSIDYVILRDLMECLQTKLTPLEKHILRARMCGFTDQEISKELNDLGIKLSHVSVNAMRKKIGILLKLI